MVETRRERGSYKRSDEQNEKLSKTLRRKYASGEIVVSEETRKKLSKSSKRSWDTGEMREKIQKSCLKKYGADHWSKSDLGKKELSKINSGRTFSKEARHNMSLGQQRRVRENNNIHSHGKGGKRPDLGHYVRSNWEANFARILLLKGCKYEYEPRSFQLDETTSYTPDFKVGDVYYEIKGYMTKKARRKIDMFRRLHPDISLVLVDGDEYDNLRTEFQEQILWEGK